MKIRKNKILVERECKMYKNKKGLFMSESQKGQFFLLRYVPDIRVRSASGS